MATVSNPMVGVVKSYLGQEESRYRLKDVDYAKTPVESMLSFTFMLDQEKAATEIEMYNHPEKRGCIQFRIISRRKDKAMEGVPPSRLTKTSGQRPGWTADINKAIAYFGQTDVTTKFLDSDGVTDLEGQAAKEAAVAAIKMCLRSAKKITLDRNSIHLPQILFRKREIEGAFAQMRRKASSLTREEAHGPVKYRPNPRLFAKHVPKAIGALLRGKFRRR